MEKLNNQNNGVATAGKVAKASEQVVDGVGVHYEYNNGVATKKITCNAFVVEQCDKMLADYATKLQKEQRKNATKMLQLADLSQKLNSNTTKKRIYANALLDCVKNQLAYDRKAKAYETITARISVAQFAKTCYNTIIFELNQKNGNTTTSKDIIK